MVGGAANWVRIVVVHDEGTTEGVGEADGLLPGEPVGLPEPPADGVGQTTHGTGGRGVPVAGVLGWRLGVRLGVPPGCPGTGVAGSTVTAGALLVDGLGTGDGLPGVARSGAPVPGVPPSSSPPAAA